MIHDPVMFIEEMYRRARVQRMKQRRKAHYTLDYPKCKQMALQMQDDLKRMRAKDAENEEDI